MSFVRAHLDVNDAPRIGDGHRIVFVVQSGIKWTRIACPFTLRLATLPTRKWRTVESAAETASVRKSIIRRAMQNLKAPRLELDHHGVAHKVRRKPTGTQKHAYKSMLAAGR